MEPIEIIVIIGIILVLGSFFGTYIYKKIKHIPTDECSNCHKGMKKALMKARKEIREEEQQERCHCGKCDS